MKSKNTYIVIGIIILISVTLKIYHEVTSMKIHARYNNIRSFSGKVPVYYKGYKVGESTKLRPSRDFKTAVVEINLRPRNIIIPANAKAKLQKRTIFYKFKQDIIEIVVPKESSAYNLKHDDYIKGQNTIDVNDFLSSQDEDSLEALTENINKTVEDLDKIIKDIDFIVVQSSRNIINMTDNLELTTANLLEVSNKLNNSVSEESLSESLNNIEAVTRSSSELVCNLNKTIEGLNNTLVKQFGLIRVLFGRPMSK